MLHLIFERLSQFSGNSLKIKEYLYSEGVMDEETVYCVRLSVNELAGNILKHSKTAANMVMECEGDLIKIFITGSRAFDVNRVCLSSSKCECGRGIYLVSEIVQSLEYLKGGKEVCVCIKRKIKD